MIMLWRRCKSSLGCWLPGCLSPSSTPSSLLFWPSLESSFILMISLSCNSEDLSLALGSPPFILKGEDSAEEMDVGSGAVKSFKAWG